MSFWRWYSLDGVNATESSALAACLQRRERRFFPSALVLLLLMVRTSSNRSLSSLLCSDEHTCFLSTLYGMYVNESSSPQIVDGGALGMPRLIYSGT